MTLTICSLIKKSAMDLCLSADTRYSRTSYGENWHPKLKNESFYQLHVGHPSYFFRENSAEVPSPKVVSSSTDRFPLSQLH